MKPKPKKITSDEPGIPSRIKAKDFPHALEQFEDKLIKLGMELETLEREAYPKVKKIVEGAVPELKNDVIRHSRTNADRVKDELLQDLFDFLKMAPVWETKFVPGTMTVRSEIEALYRSGWRYQGCAFDENAKIGGAIYHRPKLPDTFERFKKLYEQQLVDKKKLPESVKKRAEYYDNQADKTNAKAVKKAKPAATTEDDDVAGVVEEAVPAPTKKKKLLLVRRK